MTNKKSSVKIIMRANNKSIIDVTESLEYWKLNKKNEEVYHGNLIFSITELEKSKHAKAWLDKEDVKAVMHSIFNLTFESIYGPDGFTSYGGSIEKKVTSRIFNIKMSNTKQIIFTIKEGNGKIGKNKKIEMVGSPYLTVQSYVQFKDAITMAHEVYDYIRDKEMINMQKGKPLNTIMWREIEEGKQEIKEEPKKEIQTKSKEEVLKTIKEKLKKTEINSLKKLYEESKKSNSEKDKELTNLIKDEIKKREA